MVKDSPRQKRSILVIIIVALVVITLSVVGFVVWNKFLHPSKMITYTPPVVFSLSVDTNASAAKLTDAPASFKSYIVDTFYQDSAAVQPDCRRDIAVMQIYEQKYATTTETVSGGSMCSGTVRGIYGIVNGSWKGLASTEHFNFICSDLEQYKIPSAIAGTKCLNPIPDPNDSTNYSFTTVAYSQE